jgi:hypothetical protein
MFSKYNTFTGTFGDLWP